MRTRPLLFAAVAAALLLGACGSDDEGTTSPDPATNEDATTSATSPTSATSAATDTAADATTDVSADADATVMVAENDDLGEYLVDGAGRTLYLFTADDGTTTACTGGCVDDWPPLVAATPVAGDGIDADELSTADGIEPDQVTYHGHLLYFFAGDITPGDTNGVGLPSWYAVDPSGSQIG